MGLGGKGAVYFSPAAQFLAWQTAAFALHPGIHVCCLFLFLFFDFRIYFICSQWLFAPSESSCSPMPQNLTVRPTGQGEAGRDGQGRERRSLQRTTPCTRLASPQLPRLPLKHEHLLNAAATSCFLPLPALSCEA